MRSAGFVALPTQKPLKGVRLVLVSGKPISKAIVEDSPVIYLDTSALITFRQRKGDQVSSNHSCAEKELSRPHRTTLERWRLPLLDPINSGRAV